MSFTTKRANLNCSSMSKFALTCIIGLSSSTVFADCKFGAETILLGEQLTIRDERLVEESYQYYLNQGHTKDKSKQLAMSSDWTVVTVECTRQFVMNPDFSPETAEHPGSQFIYIGDVLVAGEFQREFLPTVMGLSLNYEEISHVQ
ncbi:conserved exported hypothetical protein [Vibrio crassostreae]|nr:conserved exported hypothetical protein [Vibrio crassostreae]CAK3044698.1 conserved exported hypothetical protein [Vibrio crassostreae]CAK3586123.1 conserved exported hypothetical protein [Vibrio crassostreae]CAK3984546.1 conserved exported hypothetical protein [Vibrio crassostreae]